MESKWIFKKEPEEEVVDKIHSSLGFGMFESKLLVMRGIDSYSKAREFFKPQVSDIHDPFLMKDMQTAVECIVSAIHQRKKVLIYGDYDVDGTSAVALLYLYLSKIYDKKLLGYYIPDRYTEGYGISKQGINYAKEQGFPLIISLDCGIKSLKEIDYARSLGVDFIVCDHHLPGDQLPRAVAVLDPKRRDCPYPYKELSGCGVGFKLCQALNTIYKLPADDLYNLTDLLAISIAADIVSLTGENRTLAKLGLKRLRNTKRAGLRQLIPNEKLRNFTTSNIVFEIAPKINAAGRISHGKAAVELMISNDAAEAKEIVSQIIELNHQRKEMDSSITASAMKQIADSNQGKNSVLIVYDAAWSKGVIGIVASRLVEVYYKPEFIFTDGNDGEMVASVRSVSDFDIYWVIEECSDLLLKFGGHRAAAGLTMKKTNFDAFKNRVEKIVSETIQEYQKSPSIEIDSVIEIKDLNDSFFTFHGKLAPFGPDNMKPVLVINNVCAKSTICQMGKDEAHVKFYIFNQDTEEKIECVGFGLGQYYEEMKSKTFNMAFSVEENHWRGNVAYYLNIKDIKFNK